MSAANFTAYLYASNGDYNIELLASNSVIRQAIVMLSACIAVAVAFVF